MRSTKERFTFLRLWVYSGPDKRGPAGGYYFPQEEGISSDRVTFWKERRKGTLNFYLFSGFRLDLYFWVTFLYNCANNDRGHTRHVSLTRAWRQSTSFVLDDFNKDWRFTSSFGRHVTRFTSVSFSRMGSLSPSLPLYGFLTYNLKTSSNSPLSSPF